ILCIESHRASRLRRSRTIEQMEVYFVLDDRGVPVPERDFAAWTRWFEQADRSVARTVVAADITVLSTFSGVDEATRVTPLLFQTRVFGGVLDGEELRHSTRSEAVAAHDALVEWCKVGSTPNYGLSEDQIS